MGYRIFMPYLDAQKGNEIYNFEESNQYSPPIPVPIDYDVNNPDEVCKSKEFKVIRYSIGTDEEFITISPSKYETWGKTYGPGSCIYPTIFHKKFRGMAGEAYKITNVEMKKRKKSKLKRTSVKEKCLSGDNTVVCF
ncbi:hypothetical protein Tco_0512119 [Tanacetum coccineum]